MIRGQIKDSTKRLKITVMGKLDHICLGNLYNCRLHQGLFQRLYQGTMGQSIRSYDFKYMVSSKTNHFFLSLQNSQQLKFQSILFLMARQRNWSKRSFMSWLFEYPNSEL